MPLFSFLIRIKVLNKILKFPQGRVSQTGGPIRTYIYGEKMTCLNNKGGDMMIPVAGQEILGLGGRLGPFLDSFGPAAATKLRPVGLQSTGPNQPK